MSNSHSDYQKAYEAYSKYHPNPSKLFPYTVTWRSSKAYPEKTEFTTIDEIKKICVEQNLKAIVFDTQGCLLGVLHEDGEYQV